MDSLFYYNQKLVARRSLKAILPFTFWFFLNNQSKHDPNFVSALDFTLWVHAYIENYLMLFSTVVDLKSPSFSLFTHLFCKYLWKEVNYQMKLKDCFREGDLERVLYKVKFIFMDLIHISPEIFTLSLQYLVILQVN